MRLTLVTPPAVEPLSAADARTRLGIASSAEDARLTALAIAARQMIDGAQGWLGRALITQTWAMTLPWFPQDELVIPLPPLQAVTSVAYVDTAGTTQTLASNAYRLIAGPLPCLVPAYGTRWPLARAQHDAVTVEFRAGYGDQPDDVPEAIRAALALQVGRLRSIARPDMFVTTDTVFGVGSKQFIVSDQALLALDAAERALLYPFRVW
jgi:uncharacterized phiE125 gp8 family phage protein